MRILLACPYDWAAPGGVQVHVGQLAHRLAERGHAVRVLAPGETDDPLVISVGTPMRIAYQGTVAPIAPWSRGRVRAAIREFAPDVVHAHEPFTPSVAMWATLSSPAPVVATFHAYLDRSRLLSVARPLLRRVWRRIAVPVAVSEAAASFSVAGFGGGARIIPNGVEVERFAAAEPRPVTDGRTVLWVNRLDPQKGFPIAVRAFAELAADDPNLHLVVAGDGPDREAAVPEQVRSRVHMLGTVAHGDLPGLFASADVVISPATGQESFGIVLVEAMAAGRPLVATDIPGYRDVAKDVADLVPPGDPAALAAAVARILADPAKAARMSEAGRVRAERYSWDAVVPSIEAAYADATAPAGGRPGSDTAGSG